MTPRTSSLALAALAMATAAALAAAAEYVGEPVASIAAGSPLSERANAIVEALNADTSLKGSKLTVAPDGDDLVYLTGVTVTREQMKRAMQIAGGQEGKAANAITSEQMAVVGNVPPPASASELSSSPDLATAEPAAAAADASAATEPILPATPESGEKILAPTPQS